MQFCLSITATMAFIILGLLKFLPQVSAIHFFEVTQRKREEFQLKTFQE